jgi:hypothetical protein
MNPHDVGFTDRLAGDDFDLSFLNWNDLDDMVMLWPDSAAANNACSGGD